MANVPSNHSALSLNTTTTAPACNSLSWPPGEVAQVVIGSAAVFLAILALVLKYYADIKTLIMKYRRHLQSWHIPLNDEEAAQGRRFVQYRDGVREFWSRVIEWAKAIRRWIGF